MTTLLDFHGAGLANGTQVGPATTGTGDTAFSDSTAADATRVIVTGDTKDRAIEFTQSASAVNLFKVLASAQTLLTQRFYFKTPSSWPSASLILSSLQSSGSERVRVAIGGTAAPGSFRLVNSAGTTAYTSANSVLSNSTWYRCELSVNFTSGSAHVLVYAGESLTPIIDQTVSSSYGASANYVRWGNTLSTPSSTWRMSDFTLTDTATLLGPYPVPASSAFNISQWSGSARVANKVSIWNGSTRVAAQFR